jgi:PAS domain S-box-containing protein
MEKLRQSDAWFRSTVESAPINIALYDHELRLLYVNPALAAACPRPPSELLGKLADEVWPAELAQPLKLHGARALATGERQTYELVMPRATSSSGRWSRWPGRPGRGRGSW